ncbi:MAG: bacteriohemerythrin [Pseudomonadota bacterium]
MDSVLFPWTEDLSVGIDEIDRQHRQLVDILNHLFIAVVQRRSDQVVSETLDALLDYAQNHFHLEEELMRKAGFRGESFDQHVCAHHAFMAKVDGIARKSLLENKTVAFELMSFLKHWLREHIRVTDKAYAHTLQAAGFCTRQWETEAREKIELQTRPWWKFW